MQVEYYDGGQWVGLCAPTASVPITTGLDWRNGNQQGFRLGHLTKPTDNLGMLHLSMLNYQQDNENSGFISTRIMTFNENNSDVFEFLKPVKLTQGFSSTVTLDLGGNRLINLADPIDDNDAVNLGFMNQAIADAVAGSTSVSLTGAVSGSGSGTISTTLNTRLNQVLAPTGSLNLNSQRIYNLGAPISSNDAATKAYVDAQASGGTPYINQLPINGDVNLGSYALGAFNLTAGNQVTASNFVVNNSSLLDGIGLKINSTAGATTELGFNSNTNEAYVWTGSATPIKFGTNGTKRVDIAANSTKMTFYESNYRLYFRAYSNYLDYDQRTTYAGSYGSIIESRTSGGGNGAALVMTESYMQFIQTFGNLGYIFSDEDYDPQNSYVCYISSSGSLITSSSKERKYSIYKKTQKDYLSRLNKLGVYSYALKVPIAEDDSEERKTRKYFKNKELQLGVLAEEVENLFDNATNNTKLITVGKKYKNTQDFSELTQDYQPKLSDDEYVTKKQENKGIGVDYQRLLCYTILAVQELTSQVNTLQQQLVSKK
ncbi:hypothetical protein [Cysteiniphilum halobium]|uniref:hypothetical protein n=1 Tax=Cysteiniphilum halobium TaxID=2219059 RepID=UPI003F83B37D